MQKTITLFSIIMLVGAAHGLFLTLTLVNTRDARKAGRFFLALLTLAFAIDLGHEFLVQSHYLLEVLALAFVDPVINLLYGPAFYLYTRALTEGPDFSFTRAQYLHFAPLLLACVLVFALPSLSHQQFIHIFYQEASPSTHYEILIQKTIGHIALASVLSIGCYLILSIHRLIKHARAVREQFSSIEKISLNWLRILLIALSALYFVLIFDGFFSTLFDMHENFNQLLYLMIVAVIYTMGYMGIKQPSIFSAGEKMKLASPTNLEPEHNNSTAIEKYKKSSLDSSMSRVLKDELKKTMQENKPYLESQLTLPQLAKLLGISPNYLSQVINEQFQMNFFDFINAHRVEEAKYILMNEKTKSIVDIAYDAGFNSKSAFYTAFKKHTDLTPSEFKKSKSDIHQ